MLPLAAGTETKLGVGSPAYVRHCPERTLLYQIIEEYDPAFQAHLASQGAELPAYVAQEFEAYLECGRLEHGFLRVRCETCHAEHLVVFSCRSAASAPAAAPDAWPRVPRCWSTKSFPRSRFANGC
jgi:hypothetical protein